MKNLIVLSLFAFLTFSLHSQQVGTYTLELEESTFPNIPGIHSFVVGTSNGQWLIIGGRTDGLHRRQPWASFWEEDNNHMLYVIDPVAKQVWSSALNSLHVSLFEQLQSTNMQFFQRGNTLYVIGGYGYSTTADDHITYPNLTSIKVDQTIEAIKAGESPDAFFQQIESENFRVAGGQLGYLDDRFYLVGGQKFMGRYNPHGPDHGPGFIQEYTNQIRSFEILDDGQSLGIANYQAITDTAELHRRDYNMVPQVFPNGTKGFTIFSGVFQYAADIPWLNTVNVSSNGYEVVPGFEQLLNQYHSAHLPAFAASKNDMHTVFFGGIAQFFFNDQGVLMEDQSIPFVNTISRVSRNAQGEMSEAKIGEMPDLLGAGAEFIPITDDTLYDSGILQLDKLSQDRTLVGYVFGGIKSTAANIFFVNDGTQSAASNKIYAIYLNKAQSTGIGQADQWGHSIQIFPNPIKNNQFTLSFYLPRPQMLSIELLDSSGKVIHSFANNRSFALGKHQVELTVKAIPKGIYLVRLFDGELSYSQKIVLQE